MHELLSGQGVRAVRKVRQPSSPGSRDAVELPRGLRVHCGIGGGPFDESLAAFVVKNGGFPQRDGRFYQQKP